MEAPQVYIVNVNNICRTCLAENSEMLNLFDLNNVEEGILKIFNLFSGYEIETCNGVCNLCILCVNKLREAFIFYQQCQKSGELFLKFLQEKSTENSYSENIAVDTISLNSSHDENIKELAEPNITVNNLEIDFPITNVFIDDEQTQDEIDNTECNFETEECNVDSSKQVFKFQLFPPKEIEQAIQEVKKVYVENINCIKCVFTTSNAATLTTHMRYVHKDSIDTWCMLCNQEFEDISSHFSMHDHDLTCKFCNKIFVVKRRLIEHLKAHSEFRPHKCNQCSKRFIAERHLRKHIRLHEKGKCYLCEICTKRFTYKSELEEHVKEHAIDNCNKNDAKLTLEDDKSNENVEQTSKGVNKKDSNKPQNFCQECNRKVRSLGEHMKNVHYKGSDPLYFPRGSSGLCTVCGKQYKSGYKLSIHMRTHTGELPYKCSYCEKGFRTRTQVVTHERVHTGERPYSCDICGKTFSQCSIKNTHMRLHTGRTDQCNLCGQKFCRPGFLKRHMMIHTGEKPYICNQCGQTFVQQSHLSDHMKSHSDDRPYNCTYCEKSFKHPSTLKKHVEIHMGYKPYRCSQCTYACRQSYSLTQHMKQHANDPPRPDKPHTCLSCEKSFTTFAMLSSHAATVHKSTIDNKFAANEVEPPKYNEMPHKYEMV